MADHAFDQLIQACGQAESWPLNLIRKTQLKRKLDLCQAVLHRDEKRLFATGSASVEFWELHVGEDRFTKSIVKDLEGLVQHYDDHLRLRKKDPLSCHVSISAANSRAALSCTAQMFRYICSYRQVSPIFIDMLPSFGIQYRPLGFHSASFVYDDLNKPTKPSYSHIDEIGRSDWELRHCYKLNGIEVSDHDGKWVMRQSAVYHSFDMDNGRAFWLTIKANDELRARVRDGSQSLEAMKAHNLKTLGTSFECCLTTHLVNLDWCAEGWTSHISHVESQIREVLHKVKSYPIDAPDGEPDPTQQVARALSMSTVESKEMARASRRCTENTQNGAIEQASSGFDNRKEASEPEQAMLNNVPHQQNEIDHERYQTIPKRLEKMKTFSFKEFQHLNDVSSKLKEAKLAMALNVRVLQEIREYYQGLYEAATFPQEIRDLCSSNGSLDQFKRRIMSLEKSLEIECMRADALVTLVEDGITLYNSIFQSYNTEVNKVFALSGHETSKRMESSAARVEDVTDSMYIIAKQTARDSASMHVITFFTLVFLPGTFLGTFFSTPIVGTPDTANPQSWIINHGLLSLFFLICIPMMCVTVIAWYLYLNKRWFSRVRMYGSRALSKGGDIEASAADTGGS